MKETKYTIRFAAGTLVVYAHNEAEAKILAQAEAIKKGWDYRIVKPKVTHIDTYIDWNNLTPDEDIQLRMLLSKAQTNIAFEDKED